MTSNLGWLNKMNLYHKNISTILTQHNADITHANVLVATIIQLIIEDSDLTPDFLTNSRNLVVHIPNVNSALKRSALRAIFYYQKMASFEGIPHLDFVPSQAEIHEQDGDNV